MRSKLYWILVGALFLLAIGLSTYKLSESPATWTDEGMIVQTAKNLATTGHYAFQVAPDTYISPSFISTSYPVTFPIALAFKILVPHLLVARSVMVIYILLFLLAAFLLVRREHGDGQALLALALLVSFAPLYGHGRNVLGEVPGMAFLLLGLFFERRWWSGFFFGLCIATKPLFILLLLPLLIFKFRAGKAFWLSLTIPILIFFAVQFNHDSPANILSYYSNPHDAPLVQTVLSRTKEFFTEREPAYFLLLMLLWGASIAYRMWKKVALTPCEQIAFGFALLVSAAYLRNPPFYRYFLTAELLALVFLPHSLRVLIERFLVPSWQRVAIVLLCVAQLYLALFHSWTATHYNSDRTASLSKLLGGMDSGESVLFYQAPEAVLFLPSNNYYQYVKATPTRAEGGESLAAAESGRVDYVLTKEEYKDDPLFARYRVERMAAGYVLLSHTL